MVICKHIYKITMGCQGASIIYLSHMTNGIFCENWVNIIAADALLTHLPLVPHRCIRELTHLWWWLVAWSTPSHYLNQCWHIVNWTLRNKLQWNSNQNTKLFIHENAFQNVIWEMAAILFRRRWVNAQGQDISWLHLTCTALSSVRQDFNHFIHFSIQGIVSLKFCELSKMIVQK